MTRTTRSKTIPEEEIDLNKLKNLSFEKMREFLENVSDPVKFCRILVQATLNDPTTFIMKINYQMLQMHSNTYLKEEYMSYFGLPIFTTLSETKLNHEIELCQDPRLTEAVSNVSSELKKNEHLALQAQFFSKFIRQILSADDAEFVEYGVRIITILLLQPSTRRFVKPFLEDTLFLSFIKQKWGDSTYVSYFEDAFHFPFDEISGIYFDKEEEYVAAHFQKIRSLQAKLFNYPELAPLSQMPLGFFRNLEKIFPVVASFSATNLNSILSLMGVAGFSQDIHPSVLTDAIVSTLLLRSVKATEYVCAFPTEKDLFMSNILGPLTSESLSKHELFQRHHKLLQANLFNDLSEHVMQNIRACKPVLNRNGKTEFSGWTRDAMEVLSSAIVRTSDPDVKKQGKYQRIELEISIPLAPLDQITLKSWNELKTSEVVFVCRVDANENGEFELKTMRSVIVDSKSISKNLLTLKLLVDPDQFELNSRTDVFSKLNFVIKRSSSESNDVRLIRSTSRQFDKKLPEHFEDAIIGLNHPDDIIDPVSKINFDSQNDLKNEQNQAIVSCLNSGLSICEGDFGSGCTTVLKESVKCLHENNSKSVVIFRSGPAVDKFYQDLLACNIPEYQVVRLGFSSNLENIQQNYNSIIKKQVELINEEILAKLDTNNIYTCGEASFIMRGIIQPRWEAFRILMSSNEKADNLIESYPFANCLQYTPSETFESHFNRIVSIFEVANNLAPLELLQSNLNILKYALDNLAKVVVMTSKYAAINAQSLSDSGLNFNNLFVDDCNLIPEIEVLVALTAQINPSNLTRLGLFAHNNIGRPQCFDEKLKVAGGTISLYDRFICSGFTKTTHLPSAKCWSSGLNKSNIFDSSTTFVHVPVIIGKGEEIPARNYIQNLDEAEYSVAIFQLLRLNNVSAKDIAIFAAYKGQVDLIKEVLQTRCGWTDFYGEPAFIGTIDQSIGLQFKNVIVSLVRTKAVGFLSDNSKLELAATRASENLLVLGSADLFATNGAFFESLAQKNGTELKLNDGTRFSNVEQITGFVYEKSIEKLN